MSSVTLHVRAEAALLGTRGVIFPATAKKLIQDGYKVHIERSNVRYFKDSEYAAAGCTLVAADTWSHAPKYHIIIGMKAVPPGDFALEHVHVHAAHYYRNQTEWEQMLLRFHRGGGLLLDLEFIRDGNGERFVIFGREAGSVGVALAIKTWTHQLAHPDGPELGPMPMYSSRDELLAEAKRDLANGDVGISDRLVTKWSREDTEGRAEYPEILARDIFINCVSLFVPITPFVTDKSLATPSRKLTVISDISNDSHSPNNPLPIYENATNSASKPTAKIQTPKGTLPLTIAMIPYLPSLLPREASESAANGLYPAITLLRDRHNHRIWLEVERMYHDKIRSLVGEQASEPRL